MARSGTALARGIARLRGLGGAVRDVLAGALGADAYANYRAHLDRHHPECPPLSREAFFRERQAARWSGITRCC